MYLDTSYIKQVFFNSINLTKYLFYFIDFLPFYIKKIIIIKSRLLILPLSFSALENRQTETTAQRTQKKEQILPSIANPDIKIFLSLSISINQRFFFFQKKTKNFTYLFRKVFPIPKYFGSFRWKISHKLKWTLHY